MYTLLKEYCIIIDDYYFDLFSSDNPIPLKDVNDQYIDQSKYKFVEQVVKDNKIYGDIGIADKKKGVLEKNLIFKIVTSGNKGTKCETQTVDKLDAIMKTPKLHKIDKCIKIAEQFYKNGNLKIIPYIKMKK